MKTIARLALVIVLMATTVGVASAAFTGPYYDTYVIVGNSNNSTALAMYVADTGAGCTDTWISYMQFDVAQFQTVSAATLVLTHGGTLVGLDAERTLTLYGVADFDPATLTGSNYPPLAGATFIQSVPIPTSTVSGTKVTWGGGILGLRDYIQTQADTDDKVTLAMSFSGACNPVNTQVNFYSQEYTTTPANRPQLIVEGTKPNAVNITDSTAQQTNALPLYAGLGVLGLIAVAGVAVSRRRAAAAR